jgi:hypothetical protein
MSNEEVAAIVYPMYCEKNAVKTAEAVVRAAYLKWRAGNSRSIDDITCIVL